MMILQVRVEGFGFFMSRVEHNFSFHTDSRELILKRFGFFVPGPEKLIPS